MKLTRFSKLRRSVEALDISIMLRRLSDLEEQFQTDGLPLEPQNTVFTEEGIYYVEPRSGMATKVVVYQSQGALRQGAVAARNPGPNGYENKADIESLGVFHLMQCNTLAEHIRNGWTLPHRASKRADAKFTYRFTEACKKTESRNVVVEVSDQKLFVCESCLLKASCINLATKDQNRENFQLSGFFDVRSAQSWNSQGDLAKDRGMTRDWHSKDWRKICDLRKEQTEYRCDGCSDDLGGSRLEEFLYVKPTDYILGDVGYIRLEALCITCLLEDEQSPDESMQLSHEQYLRIREQS